MPVNGPIGKFRPIVVAGGGTPTLAPEHAERNYVTAREIAGSGLGRIRDGGKPPEVKEQVRRHLVGAMMEQGRKLTAELPDIYRAKLNETVDTYRRAGLDEEALAGLRFAVAQKLAIILVG